MSKEELDNLFKNKLQDHNRPVSDNAWERLEQALPEKKKRIIVQWWQVAAAILLLCVAGMVYWTREPASTLATIEPAEEVQPSPEVAKMDPEQTDMAPIQEEDPDEDSSILQDPIPSTPQVAQASESSNITKDIKEVTDRKDRSNKNSMPEVKPENTTSLAEVIQNDPAVLPQEAEVAEALASNESSPSNSGKNTTTTLHISIEEFDDALLPDNSPTDNPTDSTGKKTGFKKLWATVKNAPATLENGLVELREAKNELLTFNKEETE